MNPGEDQQKSAEMLGVKDIAFINSTLVFSLMHLFLTETDLDSVVTEINISKKIQKWSDRATSLMTMDEMFRPLLMSKSSVSTIVCGSVHMLNQVKSV